MMIQRSATTGWNCRRSSNGPAALWGLVFLVLARPLAAETGQYTAAVHVHSRFSNGHLTPLELAKEASRRDIDVLVLTDSFLTTVRYGIWPLDRIAVRGINKMVRPGVRDHGVARYLEAVADADRQFPDVMVIPAVEVTPHYYWKGSPWSSLELHDFDRHLIVLGLSEAGILDLPVIENETWSNTEFDWRQAFPPVLLLAGGALVALSRSTRRIRLRHYRIRKKHRRWKPGAALMLIGVLLALNNCPFGRISDPYTARHDPAAYQGVIDYVREKGGIVYWSYPEAKFADVRAAGATMISGPHPEDLLLTRGYHGFEGIYGDKEITVPRPGNVWDILLGEYLDGARENAPFVITGIDFHYFKEGSRWFDLDGGQTILLLAEESGQEVLTALGEGRAYATYQGFDQRLRLLDFSAEAENGASAAQGGRMDASGRVKVRAVLKWLEEAPSVRPFTLELIENGEVVKRVEQDLPIDLEIERALPPGRHYFRLRAASGVDYRVLSNPIFVSVR